MAVASRLLRTRKIIIYFRPPVHTLIAVSAKTPAFVPSDVPRDARVSIVAARFNAHIVDELLAGCLRRLKELGFDENRIETHRVPGAFELPVAAKALVQTKRFHAI